MMIGALEIIEGNILLGRQKVSDGRFADHQGIVSGTESRLQS